MIFLFCLFALISEEKSYGKTILTNTALIIDAPSWLRSVDVRKASARIQNKMEWTTHRFNVYFYADQVEFNKIHSYGARATAITISTKDKSVVYMGPKVNKQNFSKIYSHELVHVIINQKYRGAVPKWLEEGFANHFSKTSKVNYKWLKKQPLIKDLRSLSHPFMGSKDKISYRYKVSQALVEMLDKNCDLDNLFRLSVERSMEDYIKTYCKIFDLNSEYKKWINKKSKR